MAFSDDRNSRSGTGIRCLPLQPKLRFAIWHFRPKGTPLCQPGPTAQERRNTNVQSPKGAAIKWISIPTPSNPPTGNNPQTNTLFDHHLQGRPVGAFAFWTRKPRPMARAGIDLPRCGEITWHVRTIATLVRAMTPRAFPSQRDTPVSAWANGPGTNPTAD
jgi:hypothetical protein